MKLALLISAIVEIIGGLVSYLYPDVIFSQGNPLLYRIYGLSALTIGIFTFLLFKHFEETKFFRLAYMTLMFFQGALAMIIYSSSSEYIDYKLGANLTHLILFVLLLYGYLKDLKPDT